MIDLRLTSNVVYLLSVVRKMAMLIFVTYCVPLLQDHANIPVPPSKKDFVMVGNLQKRRGGFGKIAQQSWKNRCFVLLKTGNLAYFEVTNAPADSITKDVGLISDLGCAVW